jgi:two-component system LytT family response regulator
VVKTTRGANIIPLNAIVYLVAENNYTKIVGSDKEMLSTHTLKKFDYCLNSFDFIRCHKSYLVNIAFVQEFSCNGLNSLKLTTSTEIPVSREGLKRLRRVFGL